MPPARTRVNPSAILFTSLESARAFATYTWGSTGHGVDRLIVLDLGDGRAIVIDLAAPDRVTFDAMLPTVMPIVESFVLVP